MLVSMWMLYDGLERFDAQSVISDGVCSISSIRILSDDEPILRCNVYVGQCAEFFGTDAGSIILANGQDYILVKNAHMTDIINCVIGVFEKYRGWSERINAALHAPNPFQNIMDIAHELVGSPMFFGQNTMRIYAITKQYTSEQVCEEWDEIKRLNVIPFNMIERLRPYNLPSQYPDELDPTVMPMIDTLPEARLYNYTIRITCYLSGKTWGHFFVFYKKDRVSKSVIQLIKYVTEVYEQLLSKTNEYDTQFYSHFSQLSKLLDGEPITDDDISKLYYLLNWDKTTLLTVYKITPSQQAFDKMLFDSVCNNLFERFPTTIVFPHNNVIILVTNQHRKDASGLESVVNQLISLGSYRCGRSLSFCGLHRLASFYEQAEYATMTDSDDSQRIHAFEESAFTCMAKAFRTHLNWRDWVLPSLFELIETDSSQGTEYFKTLYCLLKNKWHYGNTTKDLFIHRNTLTYRISRIKSILCIDVHDERVSSYLRLCYELMAIDGIGVDATECDSPAFVQ